MPADEPALVQTVADLAGTLGGPVFMPHLTLQGDLSMPLTALSGRLATLAGRTAMQRWKVAGVETAGTPSGGT